LEGEVALYLSEFLLDRLKKYWHYLWFYNTFIHRQITRKRFCKSFKLLTLFYLRQKWLEIPLKHLNKNKINILPRGHGFVVPRHYYDTTFPMNHQGGRKKSADFLVVLLEVIAVFP